MALPLVLHGCILLADRTVGVWPLIPSRLETTVLVIIGAVIGCSMVEEFDISPALLAISAVIREFAARLF